LLDDGLGSIAIDQDGKPAWAIGKEARLAIVFFTPIPRQGLYRERVGLRSDLHFHVAQETPRQLSFFSHGVPLVQTS
jgi:hypothetical protein